MTSKTTNLILLLTVVGIALGAVAGHYAPDLMLSLGFLGQIFLNSLKLIVLPLIFAALIVGITSLGDVRKIGRAALTTMTYFLGTGLIASAIGLGLALLIRPGVGLEQTGQTPNFGNISFGGLAESLLPTSLSGGVANGQWFGLVLFVLFVSIALVYPGREKTRSFLEFFKTIHTVAFRLVYIVMYAAPLGLLFLVGAHVAQNSSSMSQLTGSMVTLAWVALLGFAIQGLIVLPLALQFLGSRSPIGFIGRLAPALTTAFGTSSTIAAMPVAYEAVVEKEGVDQRASSFVMSLGTFINLNGTVLFVTLATVFAAQWYAVELSVLQLIGIAFSALAVSIVAAGIPGTAFLSMVIIFQWFQFPVEAFAAVGVLAGLDWFIGRFRVVIDVWGTAIGAAIIGETFEFKTARRSASDSRRGRPSERYSQRDRGRRPGVRDNRDSRDSRDRKERDSRRTGSRPNGDSSRPAKGRSERDSRPSDRRGPGRSQGDGGRRNDRGPVSGSSKKDSPFAISAGESEVLQIEQGQGAVAARQEPKPTRAPRQRRDSSESNGRTSQPRRSEGRGNAAPGSSRNRSDGASAPSRTSPRASSSRQSASERATPERVTHERVTPERVTPERVTPGRARPKPDKPETATTEVTKKPSGFDISSPPPLSLVNPSARVAEPSADRPAADKPSADKPSADKPSADKPSADKPSVGNESSTPKTSPETTNGAVPVEVIERELNRITEHLARMNSTGNGADEKSQNKPDQESVSEKAKVGDSASADSSDRQGSPAVVVDFLGTSESTTESDKQTKDNSTGSDDSTSSDKPKDKKPVSYGRKRPRRAVASPPAKESASEAKDDNKEEAVASTSEYSVEKLEFGRSKRKRTR